METNDVQIAFAGQLSKEKLRSAYALHFRLPAWGRALVGALLAIAALGLIGNVAAGAWPALDRYGLHGPQSLPILIFAGLLVAIPFWLPYLSARRQRLDPDVLRRWGRITEQGIHLESSRARLNIEWEGFVHYRRTPDLVLLYPQGVVFHPFARDFFQSDADWQAFNALVEQRVAEAGSTGKGSPVRGLLLTSVVVFAIGLLLYALG